MTTDFVGDVRLQFVHGCHEVLCSGLGLAGFDGLVGDAVFAWAKESFEIIKNAFFLVV